MYYRHLNWKRANSDSSETSVIEKPWNNNYCNINNNIHIKQNLKWKIKTTYELKDCTTKMGDPVQDHGGRLSPLLPVEIGRLVYTYLGQTNCPKTKAMYQSEHKDLRELSLLVEKKLLRNIEMDLNGRNLEDVLKEYTLWVRDQLFHLSQQLFRFPPFCHLSVAIITLKIWISPNYQRYRIITLMHKCLN